MSEDSKSLILSILGNDAVPFEARANGKLYPAWQSTMLYPDPNFHTNPVIEESWRKCSQANIRLFVMPAWSGIVSPSDDLAFMEEKKDEKWNPIVAIPEMPVMDIPEFAQIAMPWDDWKQVRDILSPIFQKYPFEFVVAYSLYAHVRFLEIPREFERIDIARIIGSFPGGSGDMCYKLKELGYPSFDGTTDWAYRQVAEYMRLFSGFVLSFH